MDREVYKHSSGMLSWIRCVVTLLLSITFHLSAHAQVSISAVGPRGEPIGDFRWLVEEDTTKPVTLDGTTVPGQSLSVSFHSSYSPVVAKGDSRNPSVRLDASKRYFVSVLPNSGYALSGASISAGQQTAKVTVQPLPAPTAQISVFAFEDNRPINNKPDLPFEPGLAGFTIILSEAGGTYGASGGQVTLDAFGNPLGSTYNPDGSVIQIGNGIIKTDANGVAKIRYLAPGKYGIQALPPVGAGWHQTATIEGTKTIDAWVKSNEPSFFTEFGPPGHHVFVGFTKEINNTAILRGGSAITGRVVNLHTSRPPDFRFYPGHVIPNCWVGLNEIAVIGGRGLFAGPCNGDGTFTIPNVPPGSYQLVVWDEFLDLIFASYTVTIPPGGGQLALGDVAVFNWFSRFESRVFFDSNKNGFPDAGEVGMQDQAINLRFRDGSIYQSLSTNTEGKISFDEVFPFFNWLIAEVDFARFKATGATVIVDAGGPVMPDAGWALPSKGKLSPQPQNENAGLLYRTETGPVLLEAFQGFPGQTNVVEWGKATYANGENGGISGIVHYATTRAENDPRYAAAENWEPGIPRVQVSLYEDFVNAAGAALPDGVIDDVNGDGSVTLADVDNHPFGWRTGGVKGLEDVDYNRNGRFDLGDAVRVTTTDSWDDKAPTNCQGPPFVSNGVATDCFDGLRNFNQVRPGVFDGGYAFGGPAGDVELRPGTYIVEAVAPQGYEHVKEEDKNVDFGDAYVPSPLALPPACVGMPHALPQYLSLFADQRVPNPANDPYVPGKTSPLCDRKQVVVAQSKNAPADFFLFTEVPVAAHVVGTILLDTANEFDRNAPNFGEKFAPPFTPVSIRDWAGREISRVYSDRYGRYNVLLPSTFTINVPMPSGVSPNMLTACINSPGPIQDVRQGSPTFGRMVTDPYFNRQLSQFCYTFQYMPSKTTYLDTPVLPVAAFAGPANFPLDCEFPDKTPVIYSASGLNGPYVPVPTSTNPANWPIVTIVSVGQAEVLNPAFDGTPATTRTIFRDYGFGNVAGSVTIGGRALRIISWTNGSITARVPRQTPSIVTGQLMVQRGDNKQTTVTGITFTIGGTTPIVVAPGGSIQAAIDSALPGALILVPPGQYNEMLIMHKKVRLQGFGAASTTINAAKIPPEKLQLWRDKVATLYAAGQFDLLPGQTTGFDAASNEPGLFSTEEGPGILVVANLNEFTSTPVSQRARIDGFTIADADHGGGIVASGNARFLEISNNRVVHNHGTYGGGIRIGHPYLFVQATLAYTNGRNTNVTIHHNYVGLNGSSAAAGGGIALFNGSDAYSVSENFVCGNFSLGDGAGIAHLGRSLNGKITKNTVIFNQNFNQARNVNGAGIYVGGLPSLRVGQLSQGTGSVDIVSNLIQGNQSAAGDGSGIRTEFVNGLDVAGAANNPAPWYNINIFNNIIANNVAGMAGAISLQDTLKVNILHNTIVNNDSTATAGDAFAPGSPNRSTPQVAGIVARTNSSGLFNAIGNTSAAARRYKLEFSNPRLEDNIVWHNRSFYWAVDPTGNFGLVPNVAAGEPALYWDLGVIGTSRPMFFSPIFSMLTSATGYATSNFAANPLFVGSYNNGDRGQTIQEADVRTNLTTAPAFDEGGNFIDVHFGPLTLRNPVTGALFGNYHLSATSPALRRGNGVVNTFPGLRSDYDNERRPMPVGSRVDIGADER